MSCRTWILCKLLSINKVFMLSASISFYLFSLA
ncbi:hypothetical protein NC652_005883 [Populus alba x Populus x berolinensis]|nr:hypothetical protein NC652_005883 [Populus alba x Populus x berolinensis]